MFRNMSTSRILTLAFNILFGLGLVAGAFGFGDFYPDPEFTEIAGIVVAILNVVRHYQGGQAVQVAQAEAAEARALQVQS